MRQFKPGTVWSNFDDSSDQSLTAAFKTTGPPKDSLPPYSPPLPTPLAGADCSCTY